MKRTGICFFAFIFFAVSLFSQQKITFQATDGTIITADFYRSKPSNPYILYFHQAGSSRGEFSDIATRLTRMGYNGLAVDLRSGNQVNFVRNETAAVFRDAGISVNDYDVKADIIAAINYAYLQNGIEVILFGSSFSASLCLLAAKDNEKVKGVIAFSPGEFFAPETSVKESLKGYKKPAFVAATSKEYDYVRELMKWTDPEQVTLFRPSQNEGVHGAKALWTDNPSAEEYWLALLMFFRNF